jgi:hypothetical protein
VTGNNTVKTYIHSKIVPTTPIRGTITTYV